MTNSATAPLPASLLEALARYDTPTICNAMEVVAPERRLIGYTTKPLVCPFPDLPPMVGYARTVTIRSVLKSGLPAEEQSQAPHRLLRICRHRLWAAHHRDPGYRRPRRRLWRVLGRGAKQRAQGARLSRRDHRRIDPRHPAMGAGLPGAGRLDRPVARLGPRRKFRRRSSRRRHDGAIGRSHSCRQPRRDRDIPDRYRRQNCRTPPNSAAAARRRFFEIARSPQMFDHLHRFAECDPSTPADGSAMRNRVSDQNRFARSAYAMARQRGAPSSCPRRTARSPVAPGFARCGRVMVRPVSL